MRHEGNKQDCNHSRKKHVLNTLHFKTKYVKTSMLELKHI